MGPLGSGLLGRGDTSDRSDRSVACTQYVIQHACHDSKPLNPSCTREMGQDIVGDAMLWKMPVVTQCYLQPAADRRLVGLVEEHQACRDGQVLHLNGRYKWGCEQLDRWLPPHSNVECEGCPEAKKLGAHSGFACVPAPPRLPTWHGPVSPPTW